MLELSDVVVITSIVQGLWTLVLILWSGARIVARLALVEWKVNYLMRLRERELGLEPSKKGC